MLLNVPFVLPALKQVRDFPARRELVADTVGVDLLELRRVLCGEHNIAYPLMPSAIVRCNQIQRIRVPFDTPFEVRSHTRRRFDEDGKRVPAGEEGEGQ